MASELDVLLDKVEDPALRADLNRQVELLRARRRFGLVFEEHLPERVQLPEHAIRRGTRVVRRDHDDDEPREVLKVAKRRRLCAWPTVRPRPSPSTTWWSSPISVSRFYPGLRRLGSLRAGGDKPAYVVIKGENHHVLEALQFTHAGKVDCIYIDPPYNTSERDWKYGNDYVVSTPTSVSSEGRNRRLSPLTSWTIDRLATRRLVSARSVGNGCCEVAAAGTARVARTFATRSY